MNGGNITPCANRMQYIQPILLATLTYRAIEFIETRYNTASLLDTIINTIHHISRIKKATLLAKLINSTLRIYISSVFC